VEGTYFSYTHNGKLSVALSPKVLDGDLRTPDPREDGATLTVADPANGQAEAIELPAKNWSRVGFNRYVYSNPNTKDGPCKDATPSARSVTAECTKLGFKLGNPQGAVTIGFQVGDADPLSALFADPDVTVDNNKLFEAVNAPANILCRVP